MDIQAHFSGTTGAQAVHPVYRTSHRTEVEGPPPSNGCHPLYSPRLKQSSVVESVTELIGEESSGFYDLKLVASKI